MLILLMLCTTLILLIKITLSAVAVGFGGFAVLIHRTLNFRASIILVRSSDNAFLKTYFTF